MTTFEVDVPMRWVDLDAQSHVNNAGVVDYLQQARIGVLLRSPNGPLLRQGIVVVSHQVEYLAPIAYDPVPLVVALTIGRVRGASLLYGYELRQRGRPVARARTEACAYDFEAGRPRRFTDAERRWFDEVAEPLEPFGELTRARVGEHAHEDAFHVRWSDQDAYGHVNNVQFFTYVGEARVALNRELGLDALPTDMASAPASTLLIARQDLRYLAQMEHRLEPYVVKTAFAQVGRTSMTFVQEIVDPDAGTTFARSSTVLVHADAAGRPTPVPDAVRAAATRWPAVVR